MLQECDIQNVYLTKRPINESKARTRVPGVPLSLLLICCVHWSIGGESQQVNAAGLTLIEPDRLVDKLVDICAQDSSMSWIIFALWTKMSDVM